MEICNNPLAEKLIAELRDRFTGLEVNSYAIAVACICDPRFKKLAFIDPQAIEQTERRLLSEMVSLSTNGQTSSPPTSSIAEDATGHKSILWQSFDNHVSAVASRNNFSGID